VITKLETLANLGDMKALAAETIAFALAIQNIPAPTFFEQERAQRVAQYFTEIGLSSVRVDDFYNVYGHLPAKNTVKNTPQKAIMITAHTDTVFEANTSLVTRHEDHLIFGAGLGDNSIGVAALLTVAKHFIKGASPLDNDLWFVATTREEGLGDLGGMRPAFESLKASIAAVINLEGLAFGHIYNAGIAVRRLKIAVKTDGGHSWLHFGHPSAIHILMRIGERITSIRSPQSPRTTYNVGIIEGGQSINSIASHASMLVDLRSEALSPLAHLENQVRAFASAHQQDEADITIDVIGDRPAGEIAATHPLVTTALSVLAHLGVKGFLERGSTDGNIPLAAGCPTVTVGVTRGGNAHRLDEYIETAPVADGLRQIILLLMATSDMITTGSLR